MKPFHVLFAAGAAAVVAAAALVGGGEAEARGHRLVNFTRGTFQPVIAAGPAGGGSAHYVLDYKVSNAAGKAVRPAVRLELRTGTGKTYGDAFDARTFRAAARELGRKDVPSSTAAIRAVELPPDGSAEGLANFGAIDPNADDLELRVYGIWDPVYRDRNGKVWSEKRVLVLTYSRTGDEYDRQYDPIRLVSSQEVLEGDPVQLAPTH